MGNTCQELARSAESTFLGVHLRKSVLPVRLFCSGVIITPYFFHLFFLTVTSFAYFFCSFVLFFCIVFFSAAHGGVPDKDVPGVRDGVCTARRDGGGLLLLQQVHVPEGPG